jgi:hypothetical protein
LRVIGLINLCVRVWTAIQICHVFNLLSGVVKSWLVMTHNQHSKANLD